jgi:hypothetical protein
MNDNVQIHVEQEITHRTPSPRSTGSDERHYQDRWKSPCCGEYVDRRAIVYFTQLGITLIAMTFCFYKLLTTIDCNESNVYFSLLGSLIGFWVKSPSMRKD